MKTVVRNWKSIRKVREERFHFLIPDGELTSIKKLCKAKNPIKKRDYILLFFSQIPDVKTVVLSYPDFISLILSVVLFIQM